MFHDGWWIAYSVVTFAFNVILPLSSPAPLSPIVTFFDRVKSNVNRLLSSATYFKSDTDAHTFIHKLYKRAL